MDWCLAEAKNKFSELFNRALAEGPQRVQRRDEAVVVISASDYDRLTGTKPGFKDFLMGEGPDLEGLDLSRDRAPMRDIDL
jgi:prevent-host-death family protein